MSETIQLPNKQNAFPLYIESIRCRYCESRFGGPFLLNNPVADAAYLAAKARASAHVKEAHKL